MTSVLLRNGYVVTVDPERRVFPNGYVHVDGERIAAVGPMDQLAPTVADEVDQVLDLDGKLVIPGLINLHDHHWASSFKGFDEGEEMESWLFSHVIPLAMALTPGDLRTASYVSSLGNGQGCPCIGRHLVHESLVERYTTEIARRAGDIHPADPRQPGVFLGPVINQRQVDHLTGVVDDTVAAGAKLLTGGKPDGQFFPPTVLTNIERSMPSFAEEVFGPVISIVPFSSDAEAVEIANDTEFGLTAAIFSRNIARAQSIAKQLNVNKIHINDVTALATAWAPLSGRGASGNAAAFGGTSDLEACTQWQWVTVSNEADVPGAFAL
jgi:hypothetical protein